jgi:hypothetical protein
MKTAFAQVQLKCAEAEQKASAAQNELKDAQVNGDAVATA